jgi:hypothetical protein
MIYLVQLLWIAAAYWLGRHDAPACDQFSNFGSSTEQQKLFHRTNWKAKAVLAVLGILACAPMPWLAILMLGILAVAIMWPVFNISLNLARRPKRAWHYLSTGSNHTDQVAIWLWGQTGGKGIVKACALIVIILNILLFLFYHKRVAAFHL